MERGGAILRGRSSTAQPPCPAPGNAPRRRRGRLGTWAARSWHGGGELSGGIDAAGAAGAGAWSAGVALGRCGERAGGVWSLQEGVWRLRASLTHVGRGYAGGGDALYRDPRMRTCRRLRVARSMQGPAARFIRNDARSRARARSASEAWSRETSTPPGEVGERLLPGLRAGLVWRLRSRRPRRLGLRLRRSGSPGSGRDRLRARRMALSFAFEERSRTTGRGVS